MLENQYQLNPNWTNETIVMLSERLGVTRTKIYKWNWDRKKKQLADQEVNDGFVENDYIEQHQRHQNGAKSAEMDRDQQRLLQTVSDDEEEVDEEDFDPADSDSESESEDGEQFSESGVPKRQTNGNNSNHKQPIV